MNGFEVVEIPKAGLFRRVLGKPPREQAFIELRNLLAAMPILDIVSEDVRGILNRYGLNVSDAERELADIYRDVLVHLASDFTLSDADDAALRRLADLFGLSHAAIADAKDVALSDVFRAFLANVFHDLDVTPVESRQIDEVAQNFGMSRSHAATIYEHEAQAKLAWAVSQVMSDRRLTAAEEEVLTTVSKNLSTRLTFGAMPKETIERARLLGRIADGDLPTMTVSIILQRGEVAHAAIPCTHLEMRTVSKGIAYSGLTGSIPIMKGLRWRTGAMSITRLRQDVLTPLGGGMLYLTNKRLVFSGAHKSVGIALSKILRFTVFSDGLQIQKHSGKDQFFQGAGDFELAGAIIDATTKPLKEE